MIKRTQFMDDKTGELCSTKIQYISAAFNEERGYLFWARKSFAKSFQDVDFPAEMTYAERGQMATLAKRIWSTTNMLGFRGRGGVRPYDTEGIARVLGISDRHARRFTEKMIRLGVLARVKVEIESGTEIQLYVNPIYFFSSNRIPLNLYLIFRKQLDEVLPGWVKDKFAEEAKCK